MEILHGTNFLLCDVKHEKVLKSVKSIESTWMCLRKAQGSKKWFPPWGISALKWKDRNCFYHRMMKRWGLNSLFMPWQRATTWSFLWMTFENCLLNTSSPQGIISKTLLLPNDEKIWLSRHDNMTCKPFLSQTAVCFIMWCGPSLHHQDVRCFYDSKQMDIYFLACDSLNSAEAERLKTLFRTDAER